MPSPLLLQRPHKPFTTPATHPLTGASVGPRLIPLEPMYIIFNLGMSSNFGTIEYDKLPFPAQMKIDWVRCVRGGGADVCAVVRLHACGGDTKGQPPASASAALLLPRFWRHPVRQWCHSHSLPPTLPPPHLAAGYTSSQARSMSAARRPPSRPRRCAAAARGCPSSCFCCHPAPAAAAALRICSI